MNKTVDELIAVLDQEAKVYDDVLKIAKNKTRIVVEGKVNDLENVVKLEQSLVLQLAKLETLRESLVEKISVLFNKHQSELTISELLPSLQKDSADQLKACQDKLVSTINDVRNTNELNSKLIKNSLEYINFSINLVADANPVSNNYGSSGQANESKKRNFFDMKL